MAKIIVLMGAPGAGKGTQARLLHERLNLPQVSTGDMFRALKEAQTPLAKEVKDKMFGWRHKPWRIRSVCPAPSNCEMKVFAYRTVPIGTQTIVQCSIEAGVTAANASSEQPARITRSAAFISDCVPALSISGSATRVSSLRLLKPSVGVSVMSAAASQDRQRITS